MATYSCHSEGVWALQANEAFTQVLTVCQLYSPRPSNHTSWHRAPIQVVSSGRDAAIYLTDLRQTERHSLVCRETSPVLRMVSSLFLSSYPLGFLSSSTPVLSSCLVLLDSRFSPTETIAFLRINLAPTRCLL